MMEEGDQQQAAELEVGACAAPCTTPTTDPDEALIQQQKSEIERVLSAGDDYHAVLQVATSSSLEEIQGAYKFLALLLHPDKCKLPGATSAFQDLNMAAEKTKLSLHEAARDGNQKEVEMFVRAGLCVDLWSEEGWSLADLNMTAKNTKVRIHEAAEKGNKEVVEMLIRSGARVNIRNADGWTPLCLATYNGHREVTKLLITAGAANNLTHDEGMALLGWAAEKGDKDLVEFLITSNDAYVNSTDHSGRTPLHLAACFGHTQVVEQLLTAGANVNMADNLNVWTSLHLAVYKGHKEVVQVLLTSGADVNIVAPYGGTPLHCALQLGYRVIVELLLKAGGTIKGHGRRLLECRSRRNNNIVNEMRTCYILVNAHSAFDNLILPIFHKQMNRRFPCALEKSTFSSLLQVIRLSGNHSLFYIYLLRQYFLDSQLHQILSLEQRTRVVIRRKLRKVGNGTSIWSKIDLLELPTHLKDYLKMMEFLSSDGE